jgi:pimeloyl-ACP methyl ester carboxylesterase/predicted Ser/Thr protein kinase
LIGQKILHYKIIEKLGAGGMGVVYKAEDTKLERQVAIKFLPRQIAANSEERERFKIEAKAAAALNHPNIATIHAIEEVDDEMFIVMEYIEGRELKEKVASGELKVEKVMDIAAQIAEGLQAAHKKSIIHRDIKSANIMVTDEGQVKIMDFGLAKVRGGAQVTKVGTMLGTAAYMSPEQARGEEVDNRTDIWSFGVVLYEMLTGEQPFKGDYEQAVLYSIMNEESNPVSTILTGTPKDIDKLVNKALAKNPDERYQRMEDVIADLKSIKKEILGTSQKTKEDSGTPRSQTVRTVGCPEVRYCSTEDGTSIAYAVHGSGPILVRVLGWFTHLEMEWAWPALRLMWERLAEKYTVVRYDGRGIGLSNLWDGEFTEETRQLDLDAILNAVGAEKAVLYGNSEGGWTAAHYASLHPERISHLIVYGSYSRGAKLRPGYDGEEDQALETLIRKGWGRDTPEIRQLFTTAYFGPAADPGLVAHFNNLQRAAADGDTAARYQNSLHQRGDAHDVFAQIRTPTLVIHCREDKIVPFEEGRRIASIIPGAKFLPFPTRTHYFPLDDDVTYEMTEAIVRFTG